LAERNKRESNPEVVKRSLEALLHRVKAVVRPFARVRGAPHYNPGMPEKKDRLPPGQYLTHDLPVLHVGSVPHFDTETWDLRIGGLVESPLSFDYQAFKALPRVTRESDLHCVTSWSRYDLNWGGVSLTHILGRANPLPEARHVFIQCDGGYTTNLTLEDLRDPDVLLADSLDGEPITREHGLPVRLVVPKKYSWKSAKWVRSIEFIAEDRQGFWEMRGYSNNADPFAEERHG
jgi:DMSO/TMAO reductase YedYZ molybdopterin-dependent catalytic subunit